MMAVNVIPGETFSAENPRPNWFEDLKRRIPAGKRR